LVAVLGVEGSGKEALLMALAGLGDLDGGLVDVASRRAVVLSPHGLVAWKRVLGNVRFGSRVRDDHEAREALDCVGIADLAHRWPGELDAEETLRVLLARALTQDPALVLLDEPFSRLSFAASERMHRVVRDLARSRELAMVVTTDDAVDALAIADRIVVMRDGTTTVEVRVDERTDRSTSGATHQRLLRALATAATGVRAVAV
jgi:sulfonate transport system ATP-binding protein